jgi:hypothetical protein
VGLDGQPAQVVGRSTFNGDISSWNDNYGACKTVMATASDFGLNFLFLLPDNYYCNHTVIT